MLSVFCSPSRYTQGKNATASLGQEMAGLGLEGPALIIAGKSAISQLSETWSRTLSEAGISYTECRPDGRLFCVGGGSAEKSMAMAQPAQIAE